jgi:uncharacterized membrane protein
MKKLESVVLNVLFFMHCFLVMLLIFESSVSIPYWIQPLGRMHPLVLHFPIAFIVLLVILNVFKRQIDAVSFEKINRFLVLITSFTTVLATIMGLFLSMEGNSSDLMVLHKWIGVAISFIMYSLAFTFENKKVFNTLLYTGFFSVFFAGHYGAGLTHGTNFITEPLIKTKVVVVNENTPIFQGFVQPILDAKCVSCHNPEKQKGDLDVSSFEKIKLGGKEGAFWVAGNPEESALLKRVHLPKADKKHMPPDGKVQLTNEEIKLLEAWIKQGANETLTLAELPKQDDLAVLVSNELLVKNTKKKEAYDFDFAKEKDLKSLESPFRAVVQKSPTSPAIDVVIIGRQTYKPELLTELAVIKNQIVSLNLSFLPIDKSAVTFISSLTNLEELLLNFTDLKTDDLQDLKACSKLKTLALSGTKVDNNLGNLLKEMPKIRKVFLWNTPISDDDMKSLKAQYSAIYFEIGFQDSEDKLQLTPPILVSKNTIISKDDFVTLGHKMPGVTIRYTTDGTKPNETSNLFEAPIKIDLETNKPLKTIALKDNWIESDVKNYTFFDKGFIPEKLELTYPGKNSDIIGDGAVILIDNISGGNGNANSSPRWATFDTYKPLNAMMDFGEDPPVLKEIVFSYGMNNRQDSEPLELLEVWGGPSTSELALLKKIQKTSRKIDKEKEGRTRKIIVELSNSKYRYYNIIAKPRKKEMLYVDQLYFY